MPKTRLLPFTGTNCASAFNKAQAAGMSAHNLVRMVRFDKVWFITFEVPA